MKRSLLVVLAALALAAPAFAQIQPQPVTQGGASFKIYDSDIGVGQGALSPVIDLTGAEGLRIYLVADAQVVANPCTQIFYRICDAPTKTTTSCVINSGAINAVGSLTSSAPAATVTGMLPYAKIQFTNRGDRGLEDFQPECRLVVYGATIPMPAASVATGPFLAGTDTSYTGIYPVMVGGTSGSQAKTVQMTEAGSVKIAGEVANGSATQPQPVAVAGYDGANIRTIKTDNTGVVAVSIAGAAAGGLGLTVNQYGQTNFPGVPSTVSLSANTSGAITGLTAGACGWVTCNAAAWFRTGTGTPTALLTDNDIPANTVINRCLPATHTAIAFISTTTATCKFSVVQ